MPRNKTEDLRNHLFAALEALADPDDKEAVIRAKATAAIAAQINSSAKNEIQYLNLLARYGEMPDRKDHVHLLGKGKTSDNE